MNKNLSIALNFLLAITLVILSAKVFFLSESQTVSISNEVTAGDSTGIVLENIRTRTSIREYKDTKIDSDKIHNLLKAGMAAPTAGNKQPWQFIVINNPELMEDIGTNIGTALMVGTAPMAIIVCGDTTATFSGVGNEFWIHDCCAAAENILLAAHAQGLGAVWCAIQPYADRISYIQKVLALPDEIKPLCIIPVGYPAAPQEPKDKWKPEYVHHNHW